MPRKNTDTRNNVLEALSVQSREGATRDEIIDLLGWEHEDSSRRSVGQSLRFLTDDDLIVEQKGRYFLKAEAPKPNGIQPLPKLNGGALGGIARLLPGRVKLPDFLKTRRSVHLEIYLSHLEADGVVAIEFCIASNPVRLPLDHYRIMIDDNVPRWSDQQETIRGVSKITYILEDGTAYEVPTDPKTAITYAPIREG